MIGLVNTPQAWTLAAAEERNKIFNSSLTLNNFIIWKL